MEAELTHNTHILIGVQETLRIGRDGVERVEGRSYEASAAAERFDAGSVLGTDRRVRRWPIHTLAAR
jgi:hypothetical protein